MNRRGRVLWTTLAVFCFTFACPSWRTNYPGVRSYAGGQALAAEVGLLAQAKGEVPGTGESLADVEGPVVSDPLEPMNRAFFTFNDRLYFWFMKPVSNVYSTFIPGGVRKCVSNAFHNIAFPIRVVNNTLQGKFKGAGIELSRFVINSTVGVGGLFDASTIMFNIPAYEEDLGQTFGAWGLGPGFYLVLPLLGPSSLRDGVGIAGDSTLNPVNYLVPDFSTYAGVRGGETVNETSLRGGEYEKLKEMALDPYIAMREAYIQYRQKKIEQ